MSYETAPPKGMPTLTTLDKELQDLVSESATCLDQVKQLLIALQGERPEESEKLGVIRLPPIDTPNTLGFIGSLSFSNTMLRKTLQGITSTLTEINLVLPFDKK
jgi:hypothetical protein